MARKTTRTDNAVKSAGTGPIPSAAEFASTGPNPDAAEPASAGPNPDAAEPASAGPNPHAAEPASAGLNPEAIKPASAGPSPAIFFAGGTMRVEDMMKMQAEFLHTIQEVNQGWIDRAKAEVGLASEFVAKLAATRSIPDAVTVSREWAGRWTEMLAEDGRRFLADSRKIAGPGTRFMSSSEAGGGS